MERTSTRWKIKRTKGVYRPIKKIYKRKIAESMVRSFSERVQTIAVSTKSVVTELANPQHSNVEQVAKEVSGDLQTVATSGADNIEKGTIGKKQLQRCNIMPQRC